jgi:hypothetical protein
VARGFERVAISFESRSEMYSYDKTRDDYGGYGKQSTEYTLALLGKVASHVHTILPK